jgi:hypothetical protein
MSLHTKVAVLVISLLLAVLAGCGGGDADPSNPPVAPPAGSFSNANLNGTYVFSFAGYDQTNFNSSFFAIVGTLTANGSGGFTAGNLDMDDPALGAALQTGYVFTHLPASGSYNVTADGRGSGTIAVTINGSTVHFGLDFVLTSGSHGLISRFDSNGSGSGSIDPQAANISQGALQGSYSFGFSGVDSTIEHWLATVGSFTLDGNGNITAGLQDFSDNGNSVNLQSLALQGSVIAGAPASAQLVTNAAGLGALRFDAWVIDATHIKLIETDSMAYLEGDAYVSTGATAFPSGTLVLSTAGEDAAWGSFSAGGLLTSDGASLITGGLEDINDEGTVVQAPGISGSFTSNGARTQLTLNGIYNGGWSNNYVTVGNYSFAAYPYSGGVMLLEIDNGAGSTPGGAGGNLYVQSDLALGTAAGYALNLTGGNIDGEVDLIAQLTTDGGSVSGLYDVNNSGFGLTDASLGSGGVYSVAPNGRGTMQFPALQTSGNSSIGALNLTFYVVDSSTAVILETDPQQSATGMAVLQSGAGGATAGQAHFMSRSLAPRAAASTSGTISATSSGRVR